MLGSIPSFLLATVSILAFSVNALPHAGNDNAAGQIVDESIHVDSHVVQAPRPLAIKHVGHSILHTHGHTTKTVSRKAMTTTKKSTMKRSATTTRKSTSAVHGSTAVSKPSVPAKNISKSTTSSSSSSPTHPYSSHISSSSIATPVRSSLHTTISVSKYSSRSHTTSSIRTTTAHGVFPPSGVRGTTATVAPRPTATAAKLPAVLRGANIGGWLVLEKWMNYDLFTGAFSSATDQWTFDKTPGAQAALKNHWDTWFTENDVAQLASWGINAVRIPIGYWAYSNSVKGTPYIKGADIYLDKAIGWCRKHGIKVLIDAHGSPGSQNGFDNSGHSGGVSWQTGNMMQATTDVLVIIAKKYGAASYSDTVFGIELTNEPISWNQNSFPKTQAWAESAYAAVHRVAPHLQIIMHDGFMNPKAWTSVGTKINGKSTSLAKSKFWIDTHLYQNQVAQDSTLNQKQHIAKACEWSNTDLLPASSNLPVIIGEFSFATNICANPDGSTLAGSVCYIDGCQCSSNVPLQYWNKPLIAATRKFVEAQLDTFETHAKGWFVWSYKGPGGWGLNNAVQYGLIGKTVTERKYPNQCMYNGSPSA